MRINTLKATHFRNIETLELQTNDASTLVLYGENGAGKTNFLEALSLLSPGFGLHKARREEQVQDGTRDWGLYFELEGRRGSSHTVGMGYENGTRALKIDGDLVPSQTDLAHLGHVMWFTPRFDRLFHDGASHRRDFFDRLVYGLFPHHAALLNRYKQHMKNRLKLLKERADSDWIGAEEYLAAEIAHQITENRYAYMMALEPHLTDISLRMDCPLLRMVTDNGNATHIAATWARHRTRDALYGSTHFGAHRTDVVGAFLINQTPLNRTSTGQHKRALLDLLLSHAKLLKKETGQAPLILLDEFIAHLDQNVRQHMLEALKEQEAQVWLTGTEKAAFSLPEETLFIRVAQGTFTPEY